MSRSLDQVFARWAAGLGLVALAFSQQPGLVVADTKLDLVIDPGRFLSKGLQAWDAQAGFGQLQNQAYGYFFPMGSFFWTGHALGLPAWVVQRLWWATLLVVAYAGFLALADRLEVGRSWGRVLGAVAYALGPRVLTVLGPISAEALPLALLPWILVPLVTGARRGSPRRAAALSGIGIACVGGINAAATLAVLIVPALWLITRRAGPRRRRLSLWWCASAGLAVAWWFLPLLVLGRYAFPFLDNIESSRTTTSVASLSNVLRGADHWVGYLTRDGLPVWHAGWIVATEPLTVLATALVAALGLWGLRLAPERTFLVAGLLVGCLCVALGYTGAAGSALGPWVQGLLDGPLAAFRNVHKFDPVLRLPVALGFTAAVGALPAFAKRLAALLPGEEGQWLRSRPRVAPATASVLVVAVLMGAAAPAWAGRLPNDGAFESVPSWWEEAATWLSGQAGRTLLEPASGFGQYTWGQPWDEPLQAMARAPWAVRGAAPLGSPGLTRYLDAVEQEISTGRPSADLAAALRRAGLGQVLLRNDLAPNASATSGGVARATLLHSPGLHLVHSFGPEVATGPDDTSVRTLEVFAVDQDTDPRVALVPDDEVAFTGGPEAVVRLAGDPRPFVDPATSTDASQVVVTDTLGRRQVNVGAPVTANSSEVLDPQTTSMGGRPLRDIDPYGAADLPQTVVTLGAGARATVSSSATDPNLPGYLGPVGGPYAVLDGSDSTSWVAAVGDTSPSWSVSFGRPTSVGALELDFKGLPAGTAPPAQVAVDSGGATKTVTVEGDHVSLSVDGQTSTLSIRLIAAPGDRRPLGMSEVRLGGLPQPTWEVADAPAGMSSTWSFATQPLSRRACIQVTRSWICSAGLERQGAERVALSRSFTSASAATLSVAAGASALAGPALDRWLDSALGHQVVGSSQRYADPAARAGAAFDGDPGTAWIPAQSDAAPTVTVSLPGRATVRGLRIRTPRLSASRWDEVVIRSDEGAVRTVRLSTTGSMAPFEAMTGSAFRLALRLRDQSNHTQLEDLAISEIQLLGLPTSTPRAAVTLTCSQGPVVVLDGQVVRTSLATTVADVVAGGALPLHPCRGSVSLPAGHHALRAVPTALVAVTAARLGEAPTSVAAQVAPVVDRWDDEYRRVVVPASGPARLLVLTEGANAGWRATVDGRQLAATRVDGWRQAWRIPPGVGGAVDLVYRPGALHRSGLVAGGCLLVVLVLLAAWPVASRRPADPCLAATVPSLVWELTTVATAAALAGAWGLLAWILGRVLSTRRWAWATCAAAWALLAAAVHATWWPSGVGHLAAVAQQVLALAVMLGAARAAVHAREHVGGAPTPEPAAPGATTTAEQPAPTPAG